MNKKTVFRSLVGLIFSLPFWSYSQIPVDGLLLHLPLNNSTIDQSSFAGDKVGGVTPAEDRLGNACGAMHFNGTDAYLVVPHSKALSEPVASITLCGWFKPEKKAGGSNNLLLPIISKGGSTPQYLFKLEQSFGDPFATITLSDKFSTKDETYQTHPLDFGKWHFFAVVFDESWVQFYLNGKIAWQGMKNKLFAPNQLPLEIGRTTFNGTAYFKGSLDDIRIYKRGLLNYEVNAIYKDTSDKNSDKPFKITMLPAQSQANELGKCGANVNYALPKVSNACAGYNLTLLNGGQNGSFFIVGKTMVVYQAESNSGAKATDSVLITVRDNEPPKINCPAKKLIQSPSALGTEVSFSLPEAEDNCPSVKIKQVSGPKSGSVFPVGSTTVSFMAQDFAGNKTTCELEIEVIKAETPILKCPKNFTAYINGSSGVVKYEEPKLELKSQKYLMTKMKGNTSGSIFPLGQHEVKYTNTYQTLGEYECTFTITVKDTSAPILDCQAPINVTCPADKNNAWVSYKTPTAKDADKTIAVTRVSGPESGKAFPVGTTIVNFEAIDAAGNKSTCAISVTVTKTTTPSTIKIEPEKEAPKKPAEPITNRVSEDDATDNISKPLKLICPADDIIKSIEPEKCGAIVNYTSPKAQGSYTGGIVQTKGLPSGQFFPPGATVNAFKITNSSGVTKECSFKVTVNDTEAPSFNCPNDTLIYIPRGKRGIIFNFKEPVPRDNCYVDSSYQKEGAKPGCFLQVGVHPFTYIAKDRNGNVGQCTFSVMVKGNQSPNQEPVVQEKIAPKTLDKSLNLGTDTIQYEHNIDMEACALTTFIYDDGEQDNDSISIVFNGQIIVDRQKIKIKDNGIIMRVITLVPGQDNYLVSKAWNTGYYGLNTLRIDVYEGVFVDPREVRNKKPIISKVMHSKPGAASGMLLNCSQ
jgi:hypothetical protein